MSFGLHALSALIFVLTVADIDKLVTKVWDFI